MASLPQSMLINVPVPMATKQLYPASQKLTTHGPSKQVSLTSISSQESVASVQNNSTTNSVSMPLPAKSVLTCASSTGTGKAVGNNASNQTNSTAVSSAVEISSAVTGVFTQLPTTAVSSTSLLTSLSSSVPVLLQQSSRSSQTFLTPTVVGQPGLPLGAKVSNQEEIVSTTGNKPDYNAMSTPSRNIPVVLNNLVNAATVGQERLPIISQTSAITESHVKVSADKSNSLSKASSQFMSTVNDYSLQIPLSVSTQATHTGSSTALSTVSNISWNNVAQTCTGQAVQASAITQTTSAFPSNSTFSQYGSSFSLSDSAVSNAAPLETELNVCSMPAPSLMSPRSLQAMLQTMLSTTDAQLLLSSMLNSSVIPPPIFKQADTANSTATMTSTAAEPFPKISPLEKGSEQFISQQSEFNTQGTEASQEDNELIPESIQDAFSDLNVHGITEQERLSEEVIFSSMLSSKANATGSGYGLGIDFEELLDQAGIVQDPVLNNL